MLEQVLSVAERLGYGVRHEWLGGQGCSACEFGGRKWLFVDLAASTVEQLEQVVESLRTDPGIHLLSLDPALEQLLKNRHAA